MWVQTLRWKASRPSFHATRAPLVGPAVPRPPVVRAPAAWEGNRHHTPLLGNTRSMRIPTVSLFLFRTDDTNLQSCPDSARSKLRSGVRPACRHRRPGTLRRGWARMRRRGRTLAALEWTSSSPRDAAEEHKLLLVLHRRVVGEISYLLCTGCPVGQLTTTSMVTRLPERAIARRALSHLRFRHPGRTWLSPIPPGKKAWNRLDHAAGPGGACPAHATGQ